MIANQPRKRLPSIAENIRRSTAEGVETIVVPILYGYQYGRLRHASRSQKALLAWLAYEVYETGGHLDRDHIISLKIDKVSDKWIPNSPFNVHLVIIKVTAPAYPMVESGGFMLSTPKREPLVGDPPVEPSTLSPGLAIYPHPTYEQEKVDPACVVHRRSNEVPSD